eukprot:m.800568 g.800568  ORF g.800568 m.800568 type:complete len:83 (-) comp59268_c2_seq1:116-364(-)
MEGKYFSTFVSPMTSPSVSSSPSAFSSFSHTLAVQRCKVDGGAAARRVSQQEPAAAQGAVLAEGVQVPLVCAAQRLLSPQLL